MGPELGGGVVLLSTPQHPFAVSNQKEAGLLQAWGTTHPISPTSFTSQVVPIPLPQELCLRGGGRQRLPINGYSGCAHFILFNLVELGENRWKRGEGGTKASLALRPPQFKLHECRLGALSPPTCFPLPLVRNWDQLLPNKIGATNPRIPSQAGWRGLDRMGGGLSNGASTKLHMVRSS